MADTKNTDVVSNEEDTYNEATGEIVLSSDTIARTISTLSAGVVDDTVFSTIKGTDMASRLSVSKALTSSLSLADNLGKTINLVEVVAQSTDYAVLDAKGNKTGDREAGVRLVLVDQDGTGYHSASKSLFRDVTKNILAILPPTSEWGGPVPIKVTEEGKKPNAYYTLTFA
jgi:hypothetical protein